MHSVILKTKRFLFSSSAVSPSIIYYQQQQQQQQEFGKLSITPPMEEDKASTEYTCGTQSLDEIATGTEELVGKIKDTKIEKLTKEEVNASDPLKQKDTLRMNKEGNDSVAKTVYMLFTHELGPYSQILYAVDLPINLHYSPLEDGTLTPEEESLVLSPVVTFPREEYAQNMCCAEVDGKLYIMGGHFSTDPRRNDCPLDVYVFDPLSASKDAPLQRGPKLNAGKYNPIAFVVGQSLYVLSLGICTAYGKNLSTFEVLTLDDANGDVCSEWVILQDSPFVGRQIMGHTVKEEKLFLTFLSGVAVYDTVTQKWCTAEYSMYACWSRAHFVGDILYTCECNDHQFVRSSRISPSNKEEDRLSHSRALAGNGVFDKILPAVRSSSSLAYLGDGRFCHVVVGSPRHPVYADTAVHKIRMFGLTLFRAFPDTYTENGILFFKAKLLHRMHFFSRSSITPHCIIRDCFVLQSCGFRKEGTEGEFVRMPIYLKEGEEKIGNGLGWDTIYKNLLAGSL